MVVEGLWEYAFRLVMHKFGAKTPKARVLSALGKKSVNKPRP